MIKGGQVEQVFEGKPPLEFIYEDRNPWAGKTYYRLEVQGGSAGKLLSNPIFIERKFAIGKALDKPPTAETSELPYSLQIASFPALDLAQKAQRYFQNMDLPIYFVKVDLGDKGIWWRLYAGYFGSKQEAMNARDKFKLSESIIHQTSYASRIGVYFSEKELRSMTQRDYTP